MSIKFLQEYDQSFKTGEDFASILQNHDPFRGKTEGSIVSGSIIAIDDEYATVDIGMKFEGQIPLKELMLGTEATEFEDLNIKVGDTVDVYIEKIENSEEIGECHAVLSREKAIRHERWPELERAEKENSVVHGIIFAKVKGGFAVDLQGVIAFLPLRQIDIKIVRDASPLMGIKQPFQILKIDNKQDNIVVSRRAILENSRAKAREELLSNIKEGQIIEGVIKNITGYGAFVDLGGIDGLLHVTDISWTRVSHPSEVLSLGQKIQAKVTKLSVETQRISLGMKQLQDNHWKEIIEKYNTEGTYSCTVTSILNCGAVVELEPGVEGLIYITEISWSKLDDNPHRMLHIGQTLNVKILSIDYEKNRVSLSAKRCTENPWENFAQENKIGDVLERKIIKILNYGFLVDAGDNIVGFISASNISWEAKYSINKKDYKIGQVVKAKILKIDPKKEQVNLGIKQVIYDPFEDLLVTLSEGDVFPSEIIDFTSEGLELKIAKDVNFLIKAFKLTESMSGKLKLGALKKGGMLQVTVTEVAPKNRSLDLLVKSLPNNE